MSQDQFPLSEKDRDAGLAAVMRQRIDALQKLVERMDQYEPKTKHYFHAGMYCREVYRDGGVLVVGKVHRKEHFYVIAQGRVLVTDGDGEAREMVAPAVIKSMPGLKRAVLSMEPTVCMTFHVTDARDVAAAEAELVEQEDSPFEAGNTLSFEVLQ